jgi:hypothetical protein
MEESCLWANFPIVMEHVPESGRCHSARVLCDWEIMSTPAEGCRTGPYMGWQAGTTTLYHGVDFISLVRVYEFGYCAQINQIKNGC